MQTACCQFDMSDLFSSKQMKLMDMAKLHCSNYELAAATKLKITKHSHLPVFLYLHLCTKRFLLWHTIVQTLIYIRHTMAVYSSNGNYDALNLKPQVHAVIITICVIYSNYR